MGPLPETDKAKDLFGFFPFARSWEGDAGGVSWEEGRPLVGRQGRDAALALQGPGFERQDARKAWEAGNRFKLGRRAP